MKRLEATNTFQEGMVMDFNPLTTPNNIVTNCLNGTLITFNGNEYVLLNDMGNGRVETAYLPEGYVPLGTAELGGIIYIVSYNPLIDKCQIGCFPSPERNITSDEIQTPEIAVVDSLFRDGRKVTNTIVKVKLLSNPNSEDGIFKLNPGDKYTIFSTNGGITTNKNTISDVLDGERKTTEGGHKVDTVPKYVTIHVVSIGEDGKITYLDDSLTWTNQNGLDYYIRELDYTSKEQALKDLDSYRTLVSSAYNIFNSKVSGELALLFELKVIDSFSVTWDANVRDILEDNDILEDYDKEAEITFNLYWTSSDHRINPSHAVLTESSKFKGSTDVKKDNVCVLPEYTDRKNDGTDDKIAAVVGTFKYKSMDELTDYTWNYQVTPSMPFGELDYLAVKGTINFAEIGSGKITIDLWRYFIYDNSINLNWGLEAYPEKNKSIEKVIFTFIPFDKISELTVITDETKPGLENFPLYEIVGKSSYSGNFQEIINFGESSRVSGEGLNKNYLYLVDVCIKYGNNDSWKYLHNYKWLYTTGQWNNQFLDELYKDFSEELDLSSVIGFKGQFSSKDSIFPNSQLTEMSLPDKAPTSTEDQIYAAMGAKILTVNYKDGETPSFDKTKTNAELEIEVTPAKYSELFKVTLQSDDKFLNDIKSKSITHNGIEVDYDSYSEISDYVESKVMTDSIVEDDVLSAVRSILSNNRVIAKDVSDKAVDSFGVEFADTESKTSKSMKLSIYGAIFSRVNAELHDKAVTVGQRIRPLLRDVGDLTDIGMQLKDGSISMTTYFSEGHKNVDAGKPFGWIMRAKNWNTSIDVGSYDSWADDKWDPGDFVKKNYYWNDIPPYDNFLNGAMFSVGSPVVMMLYAHEGTGTLKIGPQKLRKGGLFGLWCKTDNRHFVPINSFSKSRDDLAKAIALFLMQIYYIKTDSTPIIRCVVKNINRVKTFVETWNVEIESQLTVKESQSTIQLIVSDTESVSLEALQNRFNDIDFDINLGNITYNGERTIDLGNIIFSHSFKIDTNDLYSLYEDSKSTVINTLIELITSSTTITSIDTYNPNSLYVWDNSGKIGKFMALNKDNSEYINSNGDISTDSERLILSNTSGCGSLEIANAVKLVDGEIVFDEDKLLRARIDFDYDTEDHAYCIVKGNSALEFLPVPYRG